MTNEQQNFFLQLFNHGQNTGKKVTIEQAYQEMRAALKPDKSKLFSTNEYLTKNQIRSLLGRLTKSQATKQRNEWVNSNDNDSTSTTSDDDAAASYFEIEKEQESENMKAEEVDHILNSYSDNEYNSDQTE
jgi:hypothetical protein